jgi:predicted PurR-regulated permease PerM
MNSDTRWTPFVKQLVVVALLIATVFLLFRVSVIVTPLIIALFLAYLVSVPIPWVQRNTGWPRGAAQYGRGFRGAAVALPAYSRGS